MDEETLNDIVNLATDRYSTDPVDWDDLLYRAEELIGINLPEDMIHPVIREIKREVRKAQREV